MTRSAEYPELLGKLEKRFSVMEEKTLLPPEQTLADEFGVSKPTLRRALDVLVKAGNLRKINGVGVMLEKAPRIISRELVFLCNSITFFAESIRGVSSFAIKSNYLISVIPLTGDLVAQERIVESITYMNPAGVIIYADPSIKNLQGYRLLEEKGIATVHLMRLPENMDGNLVEFGNADGMTQIVEKLYSEGCRKFALYGDTHVNKAAIAERTQGFLNGLRVTRLRPRDDLFCLPDSSPEKIEEFISILADEENCPDAICCLNDHCAGKLIKVLQKRGIDVRGFRFSGFDNNPLSEFLPVPILTVEPPMAELGMAAAEMIIKQSENPQFGFHRKKLKAKIIWTGD